MKLAAWRQKAEQLELEVAILYFARRDPRVPWYAKTLATCVVGYALSPIDLIPDAIPILGRVDDFVLIPLGVLTARAMIPADVLIDCRSKISSSVRLPANWVAATIIVLIWVAVLSAGIRWVARLGSR